MSRVKWWTTAPAALWRTLAFLLLLLPSAAMAQDFSVTVDRNPIVANTPFRITFEFKDVRVDFQGPPAIEGLRYLNGPSTSNSTQIINGSRSSTRSFTYTAAVNRVGTLRIPKVSYKVGKTTLASKPITLKVVKAGDKKEAGSAQFQAVIEVDKPRVFLGEPVRVQYRIYNRLDGVDIRNYTFPDLSGAWKETVEGEDPRWENTVIRGQRFQFATLRTDLLYPTQTGELVLSGFDVNAQARISFFNSRPLNSSAQTVKIQVDPLPTVPPAPSLGTFGNLKVRWGAEGSTNTKVNEAVNLSLEFNGKGNLSLIGAPELDWPTDLEAFDPEIKDRIRTDVSGQKGKRTLTYLVIPRSEGEFDIALPDLSYFDFEKDRFVRLSPPPIHLTVAPGDETNAPAFGFNSKSDVTILTRDVRFIRTQTELRPRSGRFYGGGLHRLLWALPPLAFLLLAFLKRKRDRGAQDPRVAQRKAAMRKMKTALTKAKSGELDLDALGTAVNDFLQARLDLSQSEADRQRYAQALHSRGGHDLENAWLDIVDILDRGRFAPGAPEPRDLATQIEQAMKRMDVRSKPMSKSTLRTLGILIFTGLSLNAKASPEPAAALEAFQRGNAAYTAGDPALAIEAYEEAAQDWTSFELEYNLGGAHYKAGNIGPCILHYQRARRFRPNDDDLNANLLLAQGAVIDRMEDMPEIDFTPLWRELISEEKLSGWIAASLFFWLLGFALLALRLFRTEVSTRRTLGLTAPLVLLVALSLGILSKQTHQRIVAEDGAVVMVPRVEVKSAPAEGSEQPNLFVLHEGTVVKLMRNEGEWRQIRLSNGNTGWVKAKDLASI